MFWMLFFVRSCWFFKWVIEYLRVFVLLFIFFVLLFILDNKSNMLWFFYCNFLIMLDIFFMNFCLFFWIVCFKLKVMIFLSICILFGVVIFCCRYMMVEFSLLSLSFIVIFFDSRSVVVWLNVLIWVVNNVCCCLNNFCCCSKCWFFSFSEVKFESIEFKVVFKWSSCFM